MKKVTIFIATTMLLAVIIGAAAFAAEWRPGSRRQESETDTPRRESRDFSDEETFLNRMSAYCGRMMGGGYGERTPRGGYGGYRCH